MGAALAVMILAPLEALNDSRPAFFGWHMYATHASPTWVTLNFADGTTKKFGLHDVAARVRPEPDFRRAAAAWLCDRHPEAVTVRVTRTFPAIDWERSCGGS